MKNSNRSMSPHALCAKAIREELKKNFPEIKFSVKSESFSMGNSVSIRYTDGPITKKIKVITDKYQYGHFNGMEDIYEDSNHRDDIPQAKYVEVHREMSKEIKDKIEFKIKLKYPDFDPKGWLDSHQCWGEVLIYREFSEEDF